MNKYEIKLLILCTVFCWVAWLPTRETVKLLLRPLCGWPCWGSGLNWSWFPWWRLRKRWWWRSLNSRSYLICRVCLWSIPLHQVAPLWSVCLLCKLSCWLRAICCLTLGVWIWSLPRLVALFAFDLEASLVVCFFLLPLLVHQLLCSLAKRVLFLYCHNLFVGGGIFPPFLQCFDNYCNPCT